MGDSDKIKVPVLLGPTAAGKTELAIEVAQRLGWEILSCDSRQLYCGMNIGTAKPSTAQLQSVTHHLIDIIDPSETYSAYRFVADATEIILSRAREGKTTLLCGGTGLYYKSLSEGIGTQIESDPDIRAQLMRRGEMFGAATLHEELSVKDFMAASRIHPNDLQRIVRALAVFYQTGVPLSSLQECKNKPDEFEFCAVCLYEDREVLYDRINRRVRRMVDDGLYEEFRVLLARGNHEKSPGLQCVGYKEFFPYENKECSFDDAIELIQRNTRRYAKRQITWFSHQVDALELSADCGYKQLIDLYQEFMDKRE
ncbi:MAG: tRNA (adenosine(37)-N6)-dimethylallyltransferase MiaA [Fibrobacter sp.]|nr:tRNA (adenosine(37)-N6)-dimethylallyltransferase MiaA [Fibrobacter sp.]